MQIHELTQGGQQPVNEASLAGALKGAGAVIGGAFKQAGQQFVQKQTGITPDQYSGQRLATGQRKEAGLQMNAQLLQQMAKKGQEAWTITQQELAKKNNPPVPSAAYLTPQELEPHLTSLIQQLVGFDYNKDSEFGAAPQVNMGMKVAKNNINKSIDTILKLTKEKPDQAKSALDAAWLDLATKGIGPMQTYAQQAQAGGEQSGQTAQMHPDAAALVQSIGQTGVQALSKFTQGKTMNKTGIPAVDGLLQHTGATLK